jgi:hypothetical protein
LEHAGTTQQHNSCAGRMAARVEAAGAADSSAAQADGVKGVPGIPEQRKLDLCLLQDLPELGDVASNSSFLWFFFKEREILAAKFALWVVSPVMNIVSCKMPAA